MKNEKEFAELMQKLPIEALDYLQPREKIILVQLYGVGGNEPLSYTQVGKLYGVTRERIRQIEAKALRKLRKYVDVFANRNSNEPQSNEPQQEKHL